MFKSTGNKWVHLYLLVSLLAVFFPSSSSLAETGETRPLFFEGKAVNGEAKNDQGRFYLPLTFFAEYLHTAVVWEEATGKISCRPHSPYAG